MYNTKYMLLQREKLRLLQKIINNSKVLSACHVSIEGSNVSVTGIKDG